MDKKRCIDCLEDLELSSFSKDKSKKDGYRRNCKKCASEYDRQYRKDNWIKLLIRRTEIRAKEFGLEFNISDEDVYIPEKCPLLEIDIKIAEFEKGPSPNSPSIDRIIQEKGYTKDNIWIISHKANRIKSDASMEELELIIKNLKKKLESV